jgi:hypothetical protein
VALEDIRIGLDHGVNLSDSVLSKKPTDAFTDVNGQVQFSITADVSGEVTIYIKNETDPDNEFVITAKAKNAMDVSTDVPAIGEGQTFTVEAKSEDALITDVTVTIKFAGATYTTTTGTKTLTAPSVPATVDYPITVTAEGYIDAAATIKVVNVPALYLSASAEAKSEAEFTVTVGGDDGNGNGITVTLKDASGVIIATATSVDAKATFTAPKVTKDTEYTLTATKTGYTDATPLTITITPTGGIPGFELVTLIAAIGVALILLRRRRN